jgi:D-glucosaminate-6-phosphate ammonia-lyase
MTGSDPDKIGRLPDTTGMPGTVLIQARQRYHYERAVTVPGAHLVEVGDARGTTAAQLEAALGPNVAAVFYPAHLEGTPGTLGLDEVCAIAHAHQTPVLVDAAGRIYPLDKFRKYASGADLVAFGAKYLGALNASGILCGRKDLVEAAALHGFIGFETQAWEKSFGRPLKLDRQTIVAVVAALQEWLETDHDARLANYERRLEAMRSELEGAAGVSLSIVHSEGPSPRVLRLTIDPAQARLNARAVVDSLRNGAPAIAVNIEGDAVIVNPVTMREEDDAVVASRLGVLLL